MTAVPSVEHIAGWPGAHSVLFVSGYDEVRAALGESRLIIHKPLTGDTEVIKDATQSSRRIAPLSSVLSEHLAAREVASLAANVRALTDDFARNLQREGQCEAIDGLASPLPLNIMAHLLGLSKAPAGTLRPLFDRITAGHDFGATPVEQLQGRMALQMLIRWIDHALKSAGEPSPLMAAILSNAEEKGLSQAIVQYWCAMLLYAGSTTTRDFIGNILAALVVRQDLVHALLREPDALDTAIEELLRVEGPVRGLMREATEDITLGSLTAHKGQLVCLMLVHANRDPARFAEPERWDLRRNPNPHLALGANLTYCLGSHLARMEAKNVLSNLLPLLPYISSNDTAAWSTSRLLRGRTQLRLSWHG
jgi:cytochrome P450